MLLRAYEMTCPSLPIPNRIQETMQHGGLSILFTSITDLMAFSIGANSPLGGIRTFCIYCGVGIFLDFIFQITLFLGFMVLDSRYQQSRSVTECCCGTASTLTEQQQNTCIDLQVQIDGRSARDTVTPGTGTPISTPNSTATMSTPSPIGTPGSGSPAVKHEYAQNNVQEKEKEKKMGDQTAVSSFMIPSEASMESMDKLGHFLMDNLWVKVLVLLAFGGYIVGALVGIWNFETGSATQDLVPINSYYTDFYAAKIRYFNVIGWPIQWIIDKDIDYSDDEVMEEIDNLMDRIWSDECFLNESSWTSSWIQDYSDYLQVNYGGHVNQSTFYEILYQWLLTDEGESYAQDIWNTIIPEEEKIVDVATYESIRRSKFKIHMPAGWEHTSQIADCLDNFHRIQKEYEDSLGLSMLYLIIY